MNIIYAMKEAERTIASRIRYNDNRPSCGLEDALVLSSASGEYATSLRPEVDFSEANIEILLKPLRGSSVVEVTSKFEINLHIWEGVGRGLVL